jgi:hypothetical protein
MKNMKYLCISRKYFPLVTMLSATADFQERGNEVKDNYILEMDT